MWSFVREPVAYVRFQQGHGVARRWLEHLRECLCESDLTDVGLRGHVAHTHFLIAPNGALVKSGGTRQLWVSGRSWGIG